MLLPVLVEQMEGQIQAESTYGEGSTFLVRIPQDVKDAAPIGDVASEQKLRCMEEEAAGGRECIDLMRQKSYDLVLLDHMMLEIDGIETLEYLQKENITQNIPIIALTANVVSGAREMYMEAGFHDYMTKPISGIALEKLLMK